MKTKLSRSAVSAAALIVLTVTIGCNSEAKTVSDATGSKTGPNAAGSASVVSDGMRTDPSSSGELVAETEHGHKAGEHGGIMASLGRDSYHVEAVFEADGTVRLYFLGKDESRVVDVEVQTLKGFVKVEGDAKSESIAFEAKPQNGDAANRTSLFIGKLPSGFAGKSLEVTVPNINIAGERFRLGFKSVNAPLDAADSHSGMPDKLADDQERALYMVPGGRYTVADVDANGNTTASQKFRGIKSTHDMSPKEGDRICPITKTKANPKFTWIVDGKPYQFCCPPCVDEFVKTAKSTSEPIAEPSSYVKQ